MNSSFRDRLTRLALATFLTLGLVSWQLHHAPAAAAAGSDPNTKGDCASGYPRGSSWLNWWGYFFTTWGDTNYFNLTFYSANGPIVVSAPPAASDQGVNGNALQDASAGYQAGLWGARGGYHYASFYNNTGVWDPDFNFWC